MCRRVLPKDATQSRPPYSISSYIQVLLPKQHHRIQRTGISGRGHLVLASDRQRNKKTSTAVSDVERMHACWRACIWFAWYVATHTHICPCYIHARAARTFRKASHLWRDSEQAERPKWTVTQSQPPQVKSTAASGLSAWLANL